MHGYNNNKKKRLSTRHFKYILIVTLVWLSMVSVNSQEECRIDLCLTVDRSGSIWKDQPNQEVGRQNWNDVKQFLSSLIRGLEIGSDATYVALVAFESEAVLEFNLGQKSKSMMIDATNNLFYDIEFGGHTHTDEAMAIVQIQVFTDANSFNRQNASDVVIFVTDGKTTKGREDKAMQTVTELKAKGTHFIVIGVTDQVNKTQLEQMASKPEWVLEVKDFNQLSVHLEAIKKEACDISIPDPLPSGDCPAPSNNAVAFSAYSNNNEMIQFTKGMVIPFQMTFTNVGNGYNVNTYKFTCTCKGLYEFHLTLSNVHPGLIAAIVKNDVIVSPVACLSCLSGSVSSAFGAMSTTTIIQCDVNEQVWAKVVDIYGTALMPCTFGGNSLHGFTGLHISTMK